MSDMLQTILFGTFVPPDVPSRKFRTGDDSPRVLTSMAVKERVMSARSIVVSMLKQNMSNWYTFHDVASATGMHKDTAMKVLNALASEKLVSKRRGKALYRGKPPTLFKWMNRNAKK